MAGAALLRLLLVASTTTSTAAALTVRRPSTTPAARDDGDDGAPPPPAIVQIVADDLGYNDLGFTNGEKTRERRARLSGQIGYSNQPAAQLLAAA
jgi:hypothetical protein